MKRITAVHTTPILAALALSPVTSGAAEAAAKTSYVGTAWSIVPPLLAIAIALLFRNVIPALFIGLVTGVWILGGFGLFEFFTAPLVAFQHYIVNALADSDHASVILFSLMIGGMVGITSRNGGMAGILNLILRWANSIKRASLATIGMGLSIFFDDYANTLVVGNTMRPVTDKLRVSREKLAYLVDSTAAPVACIALITTWVGFEVGLIDPLLAKDGAAEGINVVGDSGYLVFLNSIPYSFYPILAIVLTLTIALSGRDFGPMLKAERAARNHGPDVELHPNDMEHNNPPVEGKPQRAINAVLPIAALIFTVMAGLYYTGSDGSGTQSLKDIIGNSNSYKALLWGSIVSVIVAGILSIVQRILTLEQTINSWYRGIKAMIIAMIILLLAWALSAVTGALDTSEYISAQIEDSMAVQWMPALVFLLAALTAFATGSSWGAMGILIPLLIPITWGMMQAQGLATPEHAHIVYLAISSILAGAVWGDHCSPISDTTILSSMATCCDHIEHVRTQIPYAMYAGAFALLLGIIPASFGVSLWLVLPASTALMIGGVYLIGKRV